MPWNIMTGTTALLHLRMKACCGFLSPLPGFGPANFGSNGKHAKHFTTENNAVSPNWDGGLKLHSAARQVKMNCPGIYAPRLRIKQFFALLATATDEVDCWILCSCGIREIDLSHRAGPNAVTKKAVSAPAVYRSRDLLRTPGWSNFFLPSY
jgi:hypothetical protein